MIERVLIVGYGSIGKRHLQLARKFLPNADIRLLIRKGSNKISESADGYFYSIDEAIIFAPQIAVIANPATFHIAIAQALAECGTHLLVEKPLSSSLNCVSGFLETCKSKNLILMVGYNLRHLESLQKFRDLIMNDVVGKIYSIRCEVGQYLPSWRTNADYRDCVSSKHDLGGGALLELSHELDYMRWLFGEIEWVKASLTRQSELEIDVEDSVHLIIGFCQSAGRQQLVGTMNLDFIRHDTTRVCLVIGENGSLRWDGLKGEIAIFCKGDKEWTTLFNFKQKRDDSYEAEWKNFLSSIEGKQKPLVSGEDGIKIIEIIEAIRLSETNNSKVYVNFINN